MANSSIQQNTVPNEPQMIDLLNLFKKNLLMDFNCHQIGTVQSFDETQMTASVTLNYKKTSFTFNQETFAYDAVLSDYPIIAEAPVVVLNTATTALTAPIQAGNECIVLYNDRDLDNWFATGSGSPNATARLHSYADALVLIGVSSLSNVIQAYDTVRLMIRAGNTSGSITAVGVNPQNSKVLITNTYPSNGTTLNTLLQNLITQLGNLTTAVGTAPLIATTGSPGSPSVINPAIAALLNNVTNALTTLSTNVGNLLE